MPGALLSAEYLEGKWSRGGKQGCEASDSDYLLARGNGTASSYPLTLFRITQDQDTQFDRECAVRFMGFSPSQPWSSLP
jgi:hypothetical protein